MVSSAKPSDEELLQVFRLLDRENTESGIGQLNSDRFPLRVDLDQVQMHAYGRLIFTMLRPRRASTPASTRAPAAAVQSRKCSPLLAHRMPGNCQPLRGAASKMQHAVILASHY